MNGLKAVFLCSRLQGIPSNKGELKKMACDNAHCTIALDMVSISGCVSRSGRLTITLTGICDVVIRVGIISVEVGILFGRQCFCVCVGVKEDFLTLCSTVLDSLDKDRELSEAQAEIKALKLTERSTEKAFEEV